MSKRNLSMLAPVLIPMILNAQLPGQVEMRRVVDAYQNPAVEMITGEMKIHFDTALGGAPMFWHLWDAAAGAWMTDSVIWPHPGAGFYVVYETGQDSTQGAGGGTSSPIARLDGDAENIARFNYYARETMYEPPNGPSDPAVYQVTGFAPFFWISHEPIDDAHPVEPWESGWFLPYTQCSQTCLECDPPVQVPECGAEGCSCRCSLADCNGRDFLAHQSMHFQQSIWFDGTQERPSGILFVGNEKMPAELPWHERLCEIREGRFACRMRVSLAEASPDAIAGIMFRRDVRHTCCLGGTCTFIDEQACVMLGGEWRAPGLDEAYMSPGYSLNVNRSGVIQIQKFDGSGPPTIVWNSEGTVYAPSVATPAGTRLELRTHNNYPGRLEIWVDDALQPVGVFEEPTDAALLGPHFGLFAQTAPNTSIRFADRDVFDVGIEFVATYTATPDGALETDLLVQTTAGVDTPRDFYPSGIPSPFFNVHAPGLGLDTTWCKDASGQYVQTCLDPGGCGEIDANACEAFRSFSSSAQEPGDFLVPLHQGPGTGGSAWFGSHDEQTGLHLSVIEMLVDGQQSGDAHMLGIANAQILPSGEVQSPIIQTGISPLRYYSPWDCAPQSIHSQRVRLRWSRSDPSADLWVDFSAPASGDGSSSAPFTTLAAAVGAAESGEVIVIRAGSSPETLTITENLTLRAVGGSAVIGD